MPMPVMSRTIVVAALAVVPLTVVAGCGDTSAGTANNLTPITGSNYVTIQPATTTTTTTVVPGVTAPSQVGQLSPQEQIYVVQPNDGPAKIAALYGITMDQLIAYNAYPEGAQHVFLVGEEVRIPPNSKIPDLSGTADPTADPAPTGSGDCPTSYVIQAGDTSRIAVAEQFGITFEQMDAANVNTPGYQSFIVGTPITIPCP